MTIKLYNTASRRKEIFEPLEPGRVGMYVCGVTVYDLCHIGHARSAIVFDVLSRYLRARGFEVTYVRNFTDVDDKIIERANQLGKETNVIAKEYIDAFYDDMHRIGVLDADVEPKATEHIQGMIDMITVLMGQKHGIDTFDGDTEGLEPPENLSPADSGIDEKTCPSGSDERRISRRTRRQDEDLHQSRPVEPKPPLPRTVSPTRDTSLKAARSTGATTSWATLSPRLISTASRPRLTTRILTSPR